MTKQQFKAWLDRTKWTVTEAARQLDVHRSTIHNYLSGDADIPRAVELATAQLLNPAKAPDALQPEGPAQGVYDQPVLSRNR